jgi:putative ABC transport system permease protein
MALPLSYNVKSLLARWQVTLLSIAGIALAVSVLVTLAAMAAGFRSALRATGRTDNAIVVQQGSGSEIMSEISLDAAAQIVLDPRVARSADGKPLGSREILSMINLPARGGRPASVAVRGVLPEAFVVRDGLTIVAGRRFEPGLAEVIVGRRVLERLGLRIGDNVTIRRRPWTVVGVLGSDGSGFESEIWGDLHALAEPLRQTRGYQAVVLRLTDPRMLPDLKAAIEADPRFQADVRQERRYYDDQSGWVAAALVGLAVLVGMITGLGAVFAVMNTMQAVLAARSREIGTLRALGFSRAAILAGFLVESVVLAEAGGVLGCLAALPANSLSSAVSGSNFTEMSFAFRTTPGAFAGGVLFAAVVGVLGGLLPALRAAHRPIVEALKET